MHPSEQSSQIISEEQDINFGKKPSLFIGGLKPLITKSNSAEKTSSGECCRLSTCSNWISMAYTLSERLYDERSSSA